MSESKTYRLGRADYEGRQERRRERLENAADRAAREAKRRFSTARASIAGIPPGQPILVGHHSEARHRRDLDRHDTNMRAGIAAQERAQQLAGRADSVGTAGISSDDPQAVEKLQAKLATLEQRQQMMKAVNRVLRQYRAKDLERCIAELQAAVPGLKEAGARVFATQPDSFGAYGFADYETKLNNANMRRIRQRIADLQRLSASVAEGEQARSRGGVVYQIEDNRVQLVFPGKPDASIRERLGEKGFKWARSVGAWQRLLTDNGKYAAREFIEWLDATYPQEG